MPSTAAMGNPTVSAGRMSERADNHQRETKHGGRPRSSFTDWDGRWEAVSPAEELRFWLSLLALGVVHTAVVLFLIRLIL